MANYDKDFHEHHQVSKLALKRGILATPEVIMFHDTVPGSRSGSPGTDESTHFIPAEYPQNSNKNIAKSRGKVENGLIISNVMVLLVAIVWIIRGTLLTVNDDICTRRLHTYCKTDLPECLMTELRSDSTRVGYSRIQEVRVSE